jgi:hypothetical protein
MSTGQRPTAAPTWTIRSVSVRTRDGPERLDQAYRRLLSHTKGPPPASSDDPFTRLMPDRVPDSRR